MPKGKYIVIEGHDGTGKTTQRDLIIEGLKKEGIDTVAIREPGDTPIGLELRRIIKDASLHRDALTNLLLFTADRFETWNKKIKPNLDAGRWVLSDRNWYSSWVYQGSEGLDRDRIETISKDLLGRYCNPDLAVILSADEENRAHRRHMRGGEPDTFEQMPADFQEKVFQGYYDLAKKFDLPIVETSNRSPDEIYNDIWNNVKVLI